MGFRNPATSAAAVDTRPSTAAAGVRMYEAPNPDTGQPRGVVEWRDGIAGDVPATMTQTADSNPRSLTTPYGRLAIASGAYVGVTGPELDLGVEQDQVGNPISVARLTSPGGFFVNGQAWARQRVWRFERSFHTPNPADTFTSANGLVGLIDRTITAAPAGDYDLTATLVLSGSAASVGNFTLTAAGSTVLGGTPRSDLVSGGPVLPYTHHGPFIWAGGDLRIVVAYQLGTAGVTATLQTVGSATSVAYLGPRT